MILRHYPTPILILSLGFLLLPFLNLWITKELYDLHWHHFPILLSRLQPLQYFLSFLGVAIAIGLLAKRRFGYYLFLLFAFVLLTYNVWMILWASIGKKIFLAGMRIETDDIVGNIIATGLLLTFVFYFLRKEVSAPFLSESRRGWRGTYRETHPIPFHWTGDDGEREGSGFTVNVSADGALIPLPPHHFLKLGSKINLWFNLETSSEENISLSVPGEVVRFEVSSDGMEYAGVSLSFQWIQKEERQLFVSFLDRVFAPRFPADNPVSFHKPEVNTKTEAILENVSEEGLYIRTDTILKEGDLCDLEILTKSGRMQIIGEVKWSNPEAKFGKPKGFGLQIQSVMQPVRFRLWLWKLRIRLFYSR